MSVRFFGCHKELLQRIELGSMVLRMQSLLGEGSTTLRKTCALAMADPSKTTGGLGVKIGHRRFSHGTGIRAQFPKALR